MAPRAEVTDQAKPAITKETEVLVEIEEGPLEGGMDDRKFFAELSRLGVDRDFTQMLDELFQGL